MAAVALGAFTVLGFAPFYVSWAPILTIAGLIGLWQRAASPGQAAWMGLLFGLGKFCTGVSWVYVSLHDFGGMPAALAAFATFLLALILAIFLALTGWTSFWFRRSFLLFALLAIPATWALFEWLRSWIFTGFPWLSVGYAQVPLAPLTGFAPLLGVFGVSLVSVSISGAIAMLAERFLAARKIGIVAPLCVALPVLAAGFGLSKVQWTAPYGTPIGVSLLQGNIAQDIKWRPETAISTLDTYEMLARASTSKLTIFPETALPMFLDEVPPAYLEELALHARNAGGDSLIGVPEMANARTYYNSVISLGTSPQQVYRKIHLVPFSEFIPFKWLIGWIYDDLLHMPLADFARGDRNQAPMAVADQKIAITNCYEDLFGQELLNRLPEATLLVNVSNDAWFGRSLGPQQHLQISQMRALETGRWMLRATNTGVTAFIDQRGQVISRAPEFSTTSLHGLAQGMVGATPYVLFGNLLVLALAVLMLIAAQLLKNRSPVV